MTDWDEKSVPSWGEEKKGGKEGIEIQCFGTNTKEEKGTMSAILTGGFQSWFVRRKIL